MIDRTHDSKTATIANSEEGDIDYYNQPPAKYTVQAKPVPFTVSKHVTAINHAGYHLSQSFQKHEWDVMRCDRPVL
jgi:hypothetical protein